MIKSEGKYYIIGRYANGKEVTAYELQEKSGQHKKYTREAVCFLIGKGAIANATGQMHKAEVIIRGSGVDFSKLPVVQEKDGSLTRTESLGRVRKGTDASQAMTQVLLVGRVDKGTTTIGYEVSTAGGQIKQISREQTLQLAKAGRIGNARVQMWQGKPLLRGVGGLDLKKLPRKPYQPPVGTAARVPAGAAK